MKLHNSILIGATLLVCCQSAFLGSLWQDLGREFTNMGKSMAKDLINVGLKAVNQTMNIGCKTACPRLCEDKVGMYFCPFVCVPLCNRGKRSIRKGSDYRGHLMPMPNKFSAYDLNDDGVVSLKEFAFVTGHTMDQADLKTVFQLADRNGDNILTSGELYGGPFVFEMDVNDNDYQYCQYIVNRRAKSVQQEHSQSVKTKAINLKKDITNKL
ncbi:EF-hand calcium-binding domain-containing protein 1-like [Haliotis rufescens]|uniref:EF-hand calcium-binding domain-containing protein 1-like n=1 Tax=Haliotis rufescens TaxID=6454 RepID=UPI001EB09344|nr:EF-hand calcium-binding domain-containing protein 1-like [Haliotis rufescens]